MMNALAKFQALPPNTQIWCAHEYTLNNLKFALTLEPDNPDVQQRLATVQTMRQQGEPTIPARLSNELTSNPFLRSHDPVLQYAVSVTDPLAAFAKIRKLKDRF